MFECLDVWHILHPVYLSLCGDSIQNLLLWLLRLDDQHVLLAIIILLCKRVPELVGEHVSGFLISRMLVKRDSDVTYF